MYRQLDPVQLIETARTLSNRIADRFPGSGLSRVSIELLDVARESRASIERTSGPYWPLRLLAFSGLVLLVAIVVTAAFAIPLRGAAGGGWFDLAQGIEAIVNEVVFLAIAVFFLFTLESRRRRALALRAIHELRSLAHIVDMHQLTKDPDIVMSPEPTPSSPGRRSMTRFELSRYLDYCSELLSITSKLAALQAQHVQDPVVLDAVNGIQNLTQGLSAKIWQKIMILDSLADVARDEPSARA